MVNQIAVGELRTNCIIIPLPETCISEKAGNCILVDPGGDGEIILTRLKNLNLYPRYIVITHAHFDHIAALPFLADHFPNAEIAVHREEKTRLGPQSLDIHRRDFYTATGNTNFSYVDYLWKPMPEASLLLQEGDELGPFLVLHVPGHSPGSIALYWQEEKMLLSGDTLFKNGIGRSDLPGGDQKLLIQSLKRLFTLNEDTAVYPGHGPATTIRREKTAAYWPVP